MTNNLVLEVVLSNCVQVFLKEWFSRLTSEYIQPFQDAGGWQHHSFRGEKKTNIKKTKKKLAEVNQTEIWVNKTGYVSDVALANHWDWAEGRQQNTDLFTVCSCITSFLMPVPLYGSLTFLSLYKWITRWGWSFLFFFLCHLCQHEHVHNLRSKHSDYI